MSTNWQDLVWAMFDQEAIWTDNDPRETDLEGSTEVGQPIPFPGSRAQLLPATKAPHTSRPPLLRPDDNE